MAAFGASIGAGIRRLRRRHLADDRFELRIDDRGDIEAAGLEHLQHARADLRRIDKADALDAHEIDRVDDAVGVAALQLVAALAADAEDLHRLAVAQQRLDRLPRKAHDIGVEAAAQPAIRRRHDHQMILLAAGADQQFRRAGIVLLAARKARDHRTHLFRIGTRGFRCLLRPAQLGGRHHLHGLGDLARRLDARDPVAEGL